MAEFATEAERLAKLHKPGSTEAHRVADAAPSHPLLRLQGAAGNRAVARMVQRHGDELQMKHDHAIQREDEGGEAEDEELQMKHDHAIQREDEGGEAEDEELQMKHDHAIQRDEGAEAEDEELQMKHDHAPKVGLEGGPVGPEISAQVDGARGGGTGLGSDLREKMEAGFGTDFSDVKVHQDSTSDTLNRQMTAKAFTTGNDIFLRSDASTSDEHLMAHELTHVVQQRSGVGSGAQGMTAGPADDPLEHEADATADAVLSGAAQRKLENEQA